MKLINRSFACIFFSVFTLFPAFTLQLPDIFLKAAGGLTIGDAREFVYYDNQLLSELEWPLYPMYSFTLGVDFVWQAGLELTADISAGIPGLTGIAKDSDFLNLPSSSVKTHYSQHDGFLEHALEVKTAASWNFTLPVSVPGSNKKVSIAPSAGFRYLLYKWTARDGYAQYASDTNFYPENPYHAPWTEKVTKENIYGPGIAYQQEIWMPTMALSITIPVSQAALISLGASASPFVSAYGIDNHFLSFYDFTYFDILSLGYMIEPDITLSYSVTDKTNIFLDGSWTYITGLRGDTYKRSSSSSAYTTFLMSSGNGGGASFNALAIKVGIKTQLH